MIVTLALTVTVALSLGSTCAQDKDLPKKPDIGAGVLNGKPTSISTKANDYHLL